jgi:hypothetical protein
MSQQPKHGLRGLTPKLPPPSPPRKKREPKKPTPNNTNPWIKATAENHRLTAPLSPLESINSKVGDEKTNHQHHLLKEENEMQNHHLGQSKTQTRKQNSSSEKHIQIRRKNITPLEVIPP